MELLLDMITNQGLPVVLLVFFIWKNQKEKERLIAGNSKISTKLADLTEKCIMVIQENNHNNEKLAERLGDLISNVYKDEKP